MDKIRILGGRPLHGEVEISGAKNAALLAIQILSTADEALWQALQAYKAEMAQVARAKTLPDSGNA